MALSTDEWQTCKYCGLYTEVVVEVLDHGPHYAKVLCRECKRCIGFMAKPKNMAKLEKRPNNCPTPEDLGIDHCQICLRLKEQCHRSYLCVHHIDDDPTNNDRLNLMVVCYACHALIHWMRKYYNDAE